MSERNSRGKAAALSFAMDCFRTTLLALRTIHKQRYLRWRRKRSRRSTKCRRGAFLRPVQSERSTPWNQIISFRIDDYFFASTNFRKDIEINRLLPLFEVQRTWLQPRPSDWPQEALLAPKFPEGLQNLLWSC